MAKLTMYADRSVRVSAARAYLTNLGIDFDEVSVEDSPEALEFLVAQGRDLAHYPLPQFYVGNVVAWPNGFKDINTATAEQINDKVEEINASI